MTAVQYVAIVIVQVDRLEDELMEEQDKYKSVSEELEQAFAEMSGSYINVSLPPLRCGYSGLR